MDAFKADQRPIRLGVQIAPQHAPYAAIREAAAISEDLGADIIFNWDHFYPLSGEPDGLHFESWTILAAWAEQTNRIEIGPLVNCNTYRNPNLQADMARTIDHISDGRFIFGTGSGWFERDYDEYGYEFGTVGSRLDALAADLPTIRDRWTKLNPAPTRDIPILIGGGGEKKTLRLVAEHADIWHSFGDVETMTRKLGILEQHAAEVGRDVSEIELSNELRGRDEKTADELLEVGVRLFTIGVTGPTYDIDTVRRWIAWRDAHNG
ncbi:LLM class F420-dependent oxidoreductase [Naasia lichenicola]|uniref:LLM class F420-dependent oxidoreductase n=1 Tax=Naasia lichenicola TaxID=2565933 RepID=A0A4S4FQE3_9MICO|nr:LLM class F420-dependent oxidoreductase [Naasia lichenicola]